MRLPTPSNGRFRGRWRGKSLKKRSRRPSFSRLILRKGLLRETTHSEADVTGIMSEAAALPRAPARRRAPTPRAPKLEQALIASPARFFNRELSWLAFNERVLEESDNA